MTVLEQIELHEGRRAKPYVDSVGKITIGVGRNLTDRGLREDEIDYLYMNDLREATDDAKTFPWFTGLNDARQAVVIDMCFNLGLTKFQKFKQTIAAIASGDYVKASDSMLKSKWASQVGKRAQTLARMMATGIA